MIVTVCSQLLLKKVIVEMKLLMKVKARVLSNYCGYQSLDQNKE